MSLLQLRHWRRTYRRQKARRRALGNLMRTSCRLMAISLVGVAFLFYRLDMPGTLGLFTDTARTNTITITVQAGVWEVGDLVTVEYWQGSGHGGGNNRFQTKSDKEAEWLVADIQLLEGGTVTGIDPESLRLVYNGETLEPEYSEFVGDTLRVYFDRAVVDAWLQDLGVQGEQVLLTITGEMNTAEGTIPFSASNYYYQAAFEAEETVSLSLRIEGPDTITIPAEGEVTETYNALVADGEGQEVTGAAVIWSLEGGTAGVTVDNGRVMVTSEAEEGSFTLTAALAGQEEIKDTIGVELLADASAGIIEVPVEGMLPGEGEMPPAGEAGPPPGGEQPPAGGEPVNEGEPGEEPPEDENDEPGEEVPPEEAIREDDDGGGDNTGDQDGDDDDDQDPGGGEEEALPREEDGNGGETGEDDPEPGPNPEENEPPAETGDPDQEGEEPGDEKPEPGAGVEGPIGEPEPGDDAGGDEGPAEEPEPGATGPEGAEDKEPDETDNGAAPDPGGKPEPGASGDKGPGEEPKAGGNDG